MSSRMIQNFSRLGPIQDDPLLKPHSRCPKSPRERGVGTPTGATGPMSEVNPWLNIENIVVSEVMGLPPVIHLNGIFSYRPSNYWGSPMTMESPIYCSGAIWRVVCWRHAHHGWGEEDWSGSSALAWALVGRRALPADPKTMALNIKIV